MYIYGLFAIKPFSGHLRKYLDEVNLYWQACGCFCSMLFWHIA